MTGPGPWPSGAPPRDGGARLGKALALLGAALAVTGATLQALGLGSSLLTWILILGGAAALIAALIDFLISSRRHPVASALVIILLVLLVPTTVLLALRARGNDHPGVTAFSGSCTPYRVYSQHRWEPFGVRIRYSPYPSSPTISDSGFAPNATIYVDGWAHTQALTPTDRAPYDSDIWFHLADGRGWIPYVGVRALPTDPDPTDGHGDGGRPAPAPALCEGGTG